MRSVCLAIVMCLVVCAFTDHRAYSESKNAAGKTDAAAFVQALGAGKKQVIVTMGTSLTNHDGRGWPTPFIELLNKAYPGLVTFYNEGVSGSATSAPKGSSGLDVVSKVIAHKPDVVFIEFGVNDAYQPYNISIADSRANLISIIDQIRAANPDIEVILQTTNPCTGRGGDERPRLNEYFEVHREIAKARKLRLIDHYANWLQLFQSDRPTFSKFVADGVHPSQEGYQEVVLPVLLRELGIKEPPAASTK